MFCQKPLNAKHLESNESIPCIVHLVQEASFPTDPLVINAANCQTAGFVLPLGTVSFRFCGFSFQLISLLGAESPERLYGHTGTRDPTQRFQHRQCIIVYHVYTISAGLPAAALLLRMFAILVQWKNA